MWSSLLYDYRSANTVSSLNMHMLLKLECSIEQLYRCGLFNCHMRQMDVILFVFAAHNVLLIRISKKRSNIQIC